MEIVITITRRKIANEIIETFIITPQHSFLIDPKRKPKKLLWKTITKQSIANKYKILDISWTNYCVIFKFEFNNREIDFELNKIIKFNYMPVLGKKKCSKCKALKIFENNFYCRTKSKKINKDSWKFCQEWQENVDIDLI